MDHVTIDKAAHCTQLESAQKVKNNQTEQRSLIGYEEFKGDATISPSK